MHSIAANALDRKLAAVSANAEWVANFTYLRTAEGWLYVAVVLDLFSHRVVSWSMSAQMTAKFVVDAMLMAIWRRGPSSALLHHSDQGSQYHQRAVPAAAERARRDLQHEPQW